MGWEFKPSVRITLLFVFLLLKLCFASESIVLIHEADQHFTFTSCSCSCVVYVW